MKAGKGLLLLGIVVVALTLVGIDLNLHNPQNLGTSTTQETTAQSHCTISAFPTAPNYPPCVGLPLSYSQFQTFVSESTAIEHIDGGIELTVGYHPCTIWTYVLPNNTDVMVNLGTLNASQTCA